MKHHVVISNRVSLYSSTVLVPKELLNEIKRIELKYRNLRNFLHWAVKSRHWLLGIKPRGKTGKILYQEKGQNLQRKDFRPFDGDWERFRLIAHTQRVSMTRLFMLLVLYWDGVIVGKPTVTQKITLFQSLVESNNYIYLKINRFIL